MMDSDMFSTPASPTAPPLLLDKRQRAMLKDMGIRVWSPLPDAAAPVAPISVAPESIAAKAVNTSTSGQFDQKLTGFSPAEVADATKPDVVGVAADLAETPRVSAASPGATGASWQVAAAHALYADAAPATAGAGGPRWLVLAETDAAALQRSDFHPFDGEAGRLLDNMLRAARLAAPGRVVLVPTCRQLPGDAAAPADPSAALPALIATYQPQLLLVMGRLAAQALLHSTEPLGKLRGRVHTLHGVPTVVTYDAQPLLRTPADKAKAWDDLCLAMVEAAAVFKK